MLKQSNLKIGMLLENETLYIKIGKIIDEMIYLEKLVKNSNLLVWSHTTIKDFLSWKLTVINKVPNRVEKREIETPLYVTRNKFNQLLDKQFCQLNLYKSTNFISEPVLLCTFKHTVEKEFSYNWVTGKWEEVLENTNQGVVVNE